MYIIDTNFIFLILLNLSGFELADRTTGTHGLVQPANPTRTTVYRRRAPHRTCPENSPWGSVMLVEDPDVVNPDRVAFDRLERSVAPIDWRERFVRSSSR